jgi:hypothetical protein
MSGRFASFLPSGEAPADPGATPVDYPESHAAPPPPPAPPPRPASVGRERRDLLRLREVELRDIGGLAAEMARRSDWRYPLLHSRCAEVLAIEERIHELDALIAAGEMVSRGIAVAQCQCGAPIIEGSHFCAHCGRPVFETPPVVTCSHCGQPLPADVNFCSVCGNAVAAEAFDASGAIEHTLVEPLPPVDPGTGER